MKLCTKSEKCNIKGYNGRVIGLLNAVFTLRQKSHEISKLPHITRLNWMGNGKPGGPEAMSYLGKFMSGEGQNVMWVQAIERAAHLIPLELSRNGIVNNRVDYHVWN